MNLYNINTNEFENASADDLLRIAGITTKNNTTMNSIRKQQASSLAELLREGGIVPTSEWTNGRGSRTTRRAVPPYCQLLSVSEADSILRGAVRSAFVRLITKRPRIQQVVAVTDLRGARKALRVRNTSEGYALELRKQS